jgi:hypothetical protein
MPGSNFTGKSTDDKNGNNANSQAKTKKFRRQINITFAHRESNMLQEVLDFLTGYLPGNRLGYSDYLVILPNNKAIVRSK